MQRYLRLICVLLAVLSAGVCLPARAATTLAEATKTLNDGGADANALFSLSFFFEQAGRPFSALKAIEKAIEKDGKVPGYYARHGQLLLSRKRTREAAAEFGRAADMDPNTKSFRAAQARALATCSMYKESAAAWEQLLQLGSDHLEVLDAARNAADLRQKIGDVAGAEKAWQTAFEKLTDWNDRLHAAQQLSALITREHADERAVTFWEAWLKTENDWQRRAILAGELVSSAPHTQVAGLRDRMRAVWTSLLETANDARGKQAAAAQIGELLLQDHQPADALKLVRPLVFGPPEVDLRLASIVESALQEQNDSAAVEKLWRDVIAAKTSYELRNTAIARLGGLLKDAAAITALRREAVAAFPSELGAQLELAHALAAERKFSEAVDVTYALYSAAKAKNANNARYDMQYWDELINACSQAHDTARLVKLIGSDFQGLDMWRVRNWFFTIQNMCGERSALGVAEQLCAGGNGIARLGSVQYLLNAYPDHARVLLDQMGNDNRLPVEDRRQALEQLQAYTTTSAERIALIRRRLDLGGDFWRRWNDYNQLASDLGAEGQIVEGIELVRTARKVVENNQSPAPQILRSLGQNIFRGQGVGPGLRSVENLVAAQNVTLKLYQESGGDPMFQGCFDELCRNLAELQSRRGNNAGAIEFLHKLCEVRENPALRLDAANFITRGSGNTNDAAWTEYTAYADAVCHIYSEHLRRSNQNHYIWAMDETFVQFARKLQKEKALIDHLESALAQTNGADRPAITDVLLAFERAINDPAEMQKTLTRAKGLGVTGQFYVNQQQWADAAVKLNNAGSRADAQRREQLLQQMENWKHAFAANPEDYQAALNVYKILQQLGRTNEGRPFLEQALNVAPADPLILECHARELMLDKAYGQAAKELKQAAEAAGRIDDVEATIVSAYELSGHAPEAITLALDSLENGRNQGQGIRSVQEIQDLAERSNALEQLKTELTRRLQSMQTRQRFVSQPMSGLALRVSWERNDAALTKLALDAILALAWHPAEMWSNPWEWQQLSQQAQERRRIDDAIRLLQAVLTAKTNQGQQPNDYEYRTLATLMLQAGHADDAADLMFSGLASAAPSTTIAPQALPWNDKGQVVRERRGRVEKSRPAPQSSRNAWTAAIFQIAAREVESGADTFRKAAGERFTALITEECAAIAQSPLADVHTSLPLGLADRVEAAFREALQAATANGDTYLSFARWRMELANDELDHKKPPTIKFDDIRTICKTAVEKAAADDRGRMLLAVANLYQTQNSHGLRIDGYTPDVALDAYDVAADAENGRCKLEALRPAMQFAQSLNLHARFLVYAQKMVAEFPDSFNDAMTLARAQLLSGKTADAVALLKPYLEKHNQENLYTQTGQMFLNAAGDKRSPEMVRAAAEYLAKGLELHQATVGTQLDAQGKALADPSVANLQIELSMALAQCEQFDAALKSLDAAATNDPNTVCNQIGMLGFHFKGAGKLGDLIAAVNGAIAAQPRSVPLRLAAADLADLKEDNEAELDALTVAKAISPDLETVKRLIRQLRKMHRNTEALAECKVWAANFTSDEDAHRTLAAIYKDLNDPAGELQALTMLIESAPREAVQCRKLAVMFVERKEYARARMLLERAVELRSEEPYRVVDLAELCVMSGDYARAEQLCTDALSRDWTKGLSPELIARAPRWKGTYEDRAHSVLADAYDALKQPEKAAHERMLLPADYHRPELSNAVPAVAQNLQRMGRM